MTNTVTMTEHVSAGGSTQSAFVTQATLLGENSVGLLEVRDNPAGQYDDPPVSDFNIQLITKWAPNVELDLGAGTISGRFGVGSFVVSPPDIATKYTLDNTFSVSLVGLKRDLFYKANDVIGDPNAFNLDVLHSGFHKDSMVQQLVLRMMAEAGSEQGKDSLFVDHASNTLVASLFALAGRLQTKKLAVRPLRGKMLEGLLNFMEERLAEKLTLSELAAIANMDVFRFSRAFRGALGKTPYQYILERRVARAQELLANSNAGLAAISYDCGFSSQAHFTSTFSKHVGVSPGVFRAEIAQ